MIRWTFKNEAQWLLWFLLVLPALVALSIFSRG
jgi:hypothetical protein